MESMRIRGTWRIILIPVFLRHSKNLEQINLNPEISRLSSVKDEQISASSIYKEGQIECDGFNARLNTDKCWIASDKVRIAAF